jgi:hypothetical protein
VKVFFDTNVLLDGYYERAGHFSSDEAIEKCRIDGPYHGLIAWHTILLRINFSDFPGHRNWRSECSMGILPMPFGGALAEERREP